MADRLRPSAGMRNVIVDASTDLDLELVAAALPHAVRDFGDYVVEVATFLRAQSAKQEAWFSPSRRGR